MKNTDLRGMVLRVLACVALFMGGLAQPAFAQNGPHTITAQHSNKCLGINAASPANQATLLQQDCAAAPHQQFMLVPSEGGFFQIVARHSNKCLDVNGLSQASGMAVQQYDCNGGANQLLKYVDRGAGFGNFVFKHSNKCLDVWNISQANGASLMQHDCNGGANQLFKATPVATRAAVPSVQILTQAEAAAANQQAAQQAATAAQMQAQQQAAATKAAADAKAAAEAKARADEMARQEAARKAVADQSQAFTQLKQGLDTALATFQTRTTASITALRGAASSPLPAMSGNAAADQNAIAKLKADAQAALAQNRPRTVEQTGLLQEDNQAAMEAALERARKAVDMGQASNVQLIDSYYSQMQFVSKRFADERDLALATLDQRDLAQTVAMGVTTVPEPSCPTPSDGPEFCWRDTVTRGVGTVPTNCPAGSDRIGALCYAQCKLGQTRVGLDCHAKCPPGWRNDGLFCRLAEYGRGVGYPWKGSDGLSNSGMLARCNAAEAPNSCQMWGAIAYPKCKEGYEPFGCCLCRPKTVPSCTSVGLRPGAFDLSCAKGINIGVIRGSICEAGKEMDAGLCYKSCPVGYDGVGPVCWAKAPATWQDCGMGAAKNGATCASVIGGQVTAVIKPLIAVVSAFRSGGVPTQPANPAKVNDLKERLKELRALYKAGVSTDAYKGLNQVKQASDMADFEGKINGVVTEEDVARVAAELAEASIPSGGVTGVVKSVTGIVSAYTYPKCSKYFQPNLCPAPVAKPTGNAQLTLQQLNLAEMDAENQKQAKKVSLQEQCQVCTQGGSKRAQFCGAIDFCDKTCNEPELEVNAWRKGAQAAQQCYLQDKLIDYKSCERIVLAACTSNDPKVCAASITANCGAAPAAVAPTVVDNAKELPTAPAGGWPANCPAKNDTSSTECMRLAVVSGDGQTGAGGSFGKLTVRLRWRDGTPVANFPIWFGCMPTIFKSNEITPAAFGDNGCRVDNGISADDGVVKQAIYTAADGTASTSVRGSAQRFGAPLVVVAEAGKMQALKMSHPSLTLYEWPTPTSGCYNPLMRVGNPYCRYGANGVTNYEASSVAYFNLTLSAAQPNAGAGAGAAASAVSPWDAYPGNTKAKDIGVGVDASKNVAVWAINSNGDVVGGTVGASPQTLTLGGNVKAARIAVDNKLRPWVVGTNGYVAYWDNNDQGVKGWISPVNQNPVPLASDVAVGANGTVWMVGTAANNYGIYRLTNNATWEPISSNARRIAVDPQGHAWVTWSDGTMSRYNPPSGQAAASWVDWSAEPKARDVAVAGNGTVYAVGTDSRVYQRVSGKWQLIPNMLLNEIGANGDTVFGTKPDQTIWYLR